MNFATSQLKQRHQLKQRNQQKQITSFPTTYITAQNCLSNFTEEKEELKLMIKNIDTTATALSSNTLQTESDEKKEEENGPSKTSERRDSSAIEYLEAQDTNTINNCSNEEPVISKHRTESLNLENTNETLPVFEATNLDTNSTTAEKNTDASDISNVIENSNAPEIISLNQTNLSQSPSGSPGGRRDRDSTDPNEKIDSSRTSLNNSASGRGDEVDIVNKTVDTFADIIKLQSSTTQELQTVEKTKNVSRLSERAKKKSWYNVLYPNYKSRAEDFKKLFKEVPNDERLIVDYSCALQRDILVQGRLYVSQNYVCFHANIFRWETYLCIKWKDVTSITKEKTALVIPNAISICTAKEKFFFATFTTRDKAFLMLFRVWQNTLMNKQMLPQEMWQYVHNAYGDELGLTTDDEDYIDPTSMPIETEGELDFSSALEDTTSINSSSQYTAFTNEPNSNILSVSGSGSNSSFNIAAAPTNQEKSSGKTKKSYFFSTNKSSSNSANATSGSDNKASDNNSGGDYKKIKMKPYAKELTLISAEPDENVVVVDEKPANENNVTIASTSNAKVKSKETKSVNFDGKRKISKNIRQRDENLSKNSETIPTDMSDSSDSEENKIPFVVTAECTSTHEGRQLVHTILPINIETLFNLLFSKSKFLVDFHAMRKSTDTNFPDWITDENGKKTRTVNVTVQVQASVGPKCSKVTEYQELRDCSKPGELYSVDINSVNTGIPYADSFSVLMHYCMVRTIDDHTMLSVHAQIKYKKSIWGVVKGFIEKNAWAGLEDFFGALLHSLQSETCIPPAKGKGRRPRRATTAQVRNIDDGSVASIVSAKMEPIEHLLSTHTLHLPHATSTLQAMSGEVSTTKYKWLSLFVIVLLLFLIVVNVILLHKLWKLEERIEEDMSSRARMPNLSSLKQLPNTHQEWIELLRQQEILHETELRKWHQVLQTAIDLLKKTEKTLAELMFR